MVMIDRQFPQRSVRMSPRLSALADRTDTALSLLHRLELLRSQPIPPQMRRTLL